MRHFFINFASTVFFPLLALFPQVGMCLPGQPGSIDETFAADSTFGPGKFVSRVGDSHSFAVGVSVQPDGKIILGGTCANNVARAACALRMGADGALDSTFGAGGKVAPLPNVSADIYATALQADGKLVLVGQCGAKMCAWRLTETGALDPAFNQGLTWSPTGLSGRADAVVIQPDGKMFLAGNCSGQFCVARYKADGSPDTAFGTNGGVVVATATGSRAKGIALQPDGRLVLAGYCFIGSVGDIIDNDPCVIRLHQDGSLDNLFGTNGSLTIAVTARDDRAKAVVLQPDGKILLGGACQNSTLTAIVLCAIRLNANGTLDTTFADSGKLITTTRNDSNDWGPAIALQPDGRVILSGKCLGDFCVLRFNGDGSSDTSFGAMGTALTSFSAGADEAYTLALQPDGKIVVAGWCPNGQTAEFCAARYNGGPFGYKSCSLDIDGDNRVLATTDSLLFARIALGITGPAVIGGITFAPHATRNTWPLIRDYLVTQCGMSLVP